MPGQAPPPGAPETPGAPDEEDPRICFCMKVSRSTLVAAIRAGATTVEALRDRTRAASGCGTCRIDLLLLLAEHADRGPTTTGPGPAGTAPRS